MSPQKPESGFLDRLGGRFLVRGRSGEYVEILIFRDDLVAASGFEAAVRGEVARLADFRHATIRRIRGVARLAEPDNRLALVSDSSPGKRLSEILAVAEHENRPVSTRAMLFVIREVLAALHALHEASGGVCHGALGPERIVVTPDGQVLVVEHVLASALDCHTAATQERFWRDYRVAVVEEDETPRFGQRTDVLQIGLVALALVLGRPLRRDEFPRRIGELLLGATETGPLGSRTPLGLSLRAWLARALQFGSQDSYATVWQALDGLERILGMNGYVAEPSSVLTMLTPRLETVEAEPSPVPERDSGPHAVAAPAEPAHVAEQHPMPLSVSPSEKPWAAVVEGPTPTAETTLPHKNASVGPPPGFRITPEAAAVPDTGSGPVSVESLSTPAGVECIAAEVRVQSPPTPRSGAHRTAARSSTQPTSGTSRQPAAELRLVRTPPVPAFAVFGATGADEMPSPGSRRRWIIIGTAAAGLILAAGIPGVWFLTRPAAPRPAPTSVEARPSPSGASMDATAAGPVMPSAPRADGHAGSAPATVPPAVPSQVEATSAPPVAGTPDAAGTPDVPARAPEVPASTPDAGAKVAEPALRAGHITVTAPLPMEIVEKGYLLGSSTGAPISLAAGRHEIELVNESVGYRDTRAVDVFAGRTVAIDITLPKGSVSFNATPWAEVWVDGQKIGETPVANVEMTAGPHEVSFRHPQLGERRLTIVVPVNGPQRVSMDMRKQ
jgi:serine/threonine protein kinase